MNPTLEDTFDVGASDDDENDGDDRQRLMRGNVPSSPNTHSGFHSGVSAVREVATPSNAARGNSGGAAIASSYSLSNNDGVFANLNAKPELGEKTEEQPPVSATCAKSKGCC